MKFRNRENERRINDCLAVDAADTLSAGVPLWQVETIAIWQREIYSERKS